MFSQYPFFPCPLLLCIAFSSWAWARGARKHQKHFSSRLTLSIEFFKVPCRSSLLYTPLHSNTELHSSSCSVAVSSSIVLGSFYLSVLSSIFKKRFTSFTVVLKPSSCLFLSTGVSHSSPARPARTNSISVATHQIWLFITTPRACAMKSKLDRPHPLVEYTS